MRNFLDQRDKKDAGGRKAVEPGGTECNIEVKAVPG